MRGDRQPILPIEITLAILAGGESSRMGIPKAHLTLSGRPILHYLLDQIAWPGPTMLVTAPGREYPPGCERFTVEAIDPQPAGGPLRGVLTALENVTTPLLLILTVDMPAIRRVHCDFLVDCIQAESSRIGVMLRRKSDRRVRLGGRGSVDSELPRPPRRTLHSENIPLDAEGLQIEPFPCAMKAEALPIIARRLAENRRSTYALLEEPGFVALEAPPGDWDDSAWTNLNTPGDLEQFQRRDSA